MVRSQTLRVIGDQSASTLKDVVIEMEQFRAVVGELFPKAQRPIALPTSVFIFGKRKNAQPFMPLASGGKPAQIAGYFSRGQDMNAILMALEGFDRAFRSTLISDLDDRDFTIACGSRDRPEWIYLTWTPGDNAASAKGDGTAALEFLPRGYRP